MDHCSDGGGESDEDMSSEDESLASEGEDDSEYEAESDEEAGAQLAGAAGVGNCSLINSGIGVV